MPIRINRASHIAFLATTLLAGAAYVVIPCPSSRAASEREQATHDPQAEASDKEGEHAGHAGMMGGGMQGCMQGGMRDGGMPGCKMMGGGHEGMMGGDHEGMMGGGHEGMMGGDHEGMMGGGHEGMMGGGGHEGMMGGGHEGMKGAPSGMMPGEMRKKMHEMMVEMASHADERIAKLKTDLVITDAQLPQWNVFAEALRSAAKSMEQMHKEMMAWEATEAAEPKLKPPPSTEPARSGDTSYPGMEAVKKVAPAPAPAAPAEKHAKSLPEKLEAHEKRLSLHLDSLKSIKAALDPLYATFDDKQKSIADRLKIGPMGVM